MNQNLPYDIGLTFFSFPAALTTTARANFNSGGIVGTVTFVQATADVNVTVLVNLTELPHSGALFIYQHPVLDATISSPCTTQRLGSIFDPCINSIDLPCAMVPAGNLASQYVPLIILF